LLLLLRLLLLGCDNHSLRGPALGILITTTSGGLPLDATRASTTKW